MTTKLANPVVHLELHTGNLARACTFYAEICGWSPERIDCPRGSYQSLAIGNGLDGGIVECRTDRPLWLPYVGVEEVAEATERARQLGGTVLLEPREGPSGWRSVIAAPSGGEIAFWQPKDPAPAVTAISHHEEDCKDNGRRTR